LKLKKPSDLKNQGAFSVVANKVAEKEGWRCPLFRPI
jgi:hypothetical protein